MSRFSRIFANYKDPIILGVIFSPVGYIALNYKNLPKPNQCQTNKRTYTGYLIRNGYQIEFEIPAGALTDENRKGIVNPQFAIYRANKAKITSIYSYDDYYKKGVTERLDIVDLGTYNNTTKKSLIYKIGDIIDENFDTNIDNVESNIMTNYNNSCPIIYFKCHFAAVIFYKFKCEFWHPAVDFYTGDFIWPLALKAFELY